MLIFNKTGRVVRNLKFHYGSENIAIAGEYKYLGILFKPSRVFSHTIKAMKAIFCIRKQLVSDRLNVLQHIKLFETCVRQILLYCSELTSTDVVVRENTNIENRYKIYIAEEILIKFSKMVLGVNRSAVSSAVLAELGLLPLSVCALKLSVGFLLYLLQSDENSLKSIS